MSLIEIQKQLEELRRRDPDFKIFGASEHRYQSTRMTMSGMLRLEEKMGIELPLEYREFLLDIGYGAGPAYGLFSPMRSRAVFRDLTSSRTVRDEERILPSDWFPLTRKSIAEIDARRAAGMRHTAEKIDQPCGGYWPISHEGCTYWSVIVLTGEFAGSVWDTNGGWAWLPGGRQEGLFGWPPPKLVELPPLPCPPTFLEWYQGWLERCLTDLSAPD